MNYLLVGCGGAIGSMLRYLTVDLIGRFFPVISFPFGTLIVNVVGCFFIAFIGSLATDRVNLSSDSRLFLFTGILGGFTTFSAFGYETFHLLKTSQLTWALLNILANLCLGLGAVAAGYYAGRQLL